jgi:epoxyqueuosine reductase
MRRIRPDLNDTVRAEGIDSPAWPPAWRDDLPASVRWPVAVVREQPAEPRSIAGGFPRNRVDTVPSAKLVDALQAEAARKGFSLFGVAPAAEADGFGRFCDWLAAGYAGEMAYLHEQGPQRRHPGSVVENVRSVVMLGMEYRVPSTEYPVPSTQHPTASIEYPGSSTQHPTASIEYPGSSTQHPTASIEYPAASTQHPTASIQYPAERGVDNPKGTTRYSVLGTRYSRVAAYAQGPDYHRHIWDRLNELAAWLMAEVPGSYAHGVTDTAPLLERDFARRAGLGWFGKNTMLINRNRGSYFFLASLLTSLELPANDPEPANHCGTCTACLDACPTQAFVEPGTLDARKCISYLTIELRTPIPEPLREAVGDWIFGCDVCQQVCPWNRFAGKGVAFPHRDDLEALDPLEILGLGEAEYRRRFKGTSIFRAQWPGLRRNAAIVLGNVGGREAIPMLEDAARDPDEMVAEAAAWALDRVRQRISRV